MWAVFMSFRKQEIILPFRKKEFTYSESRRLKAKTDLGNGDQAFVDHGRLLYTSHLKKHPIIHTSPVPTQPKLAK